jgi:hypothetical protein
LDGVDAAALEADFAAERGRSAAPPVFPRVDAPSPAVPPPAPPAESDWLLGDLDLASLDAEFAAERGRSAAPPPDLHAEPVPAAPPSATPAPPPPPVPGHVPPSVLPPPPAGLVPLSPGTLREQDPLDSNALPEWLVGGAPAAPASPPAPTPPPARHLFAHGPAPKPGPRWVIPCPHCGEDIDFEMLLSIAEYRD